ncbi:MAG: hemerythrin domain-containing protein [Thermodesulfobacteriota bacterium]|jgi:hemerythrin-like domain-containing protein|nr:MAG: hemerythrin domain-containing protein [Thermodesulfobacteriota bacterium]
MKATQQLRDEHEGVKIMLSILKQVCHQLGSTGNLNKEHLEGILEFLKVFVDKCHHSKEEELLFPALVAAGVPADGPIAVMLHEHEMGRNYIRAMSDAYATYMVGDKSSSQGIMQNAHGYISLLKGHIEKENTVLFVMADNLLSEKRQDELFEGFEKIEEERIGVGKHEQFHSLIKKLSGIYLTK